MGVYNKKRCKICNHNSDYLKNYRGMRVCPECLDKELGRLIFFENAPFTGADMPCGGCP